MTKQTNKKYVLTYEADVKSYVDGVEKISTTTRRMAVNSTQSAAMVEAAVSKSGLKNVQVYEETATSLARSVKDQLAQNSKLVKSTQTTATQIKAANDATYKSVQNNNRANRAIMQSAGYQLQDTLVQLGTNTNAWMILGQQGSQFASSFGAGGAVAGALISLIGLLGMVAGGGEEAAGSFDKLAEGTEKLTEAEKRLARATADSRATDAFLDVEEYKAKLEALNVELKNTQKEDRGFLDSLTGRSEAEVAKEIDEVTVSLEQATAAMEQFRTLSGRTTSAPFPDIGTSNVYDAEYKSRLATLNETTKAMERQTRTFEEEYAHRKALIDSFLLTEDEAARHYGALEAWKTNELKKEADKREKINQREVMSNLQAQISAENARKSSLSSSVGQVEQLVPPPEYSDYEAELARHKAFQEAYAQAIAATNQWDLNERTRLNNAKEMEETRHAAAMNKIVTESLEDQVKAQMSGYEQLATTLAGAAEEGSTAYKVLFAVQQGFAIANGTMQAFSTAQTAYATAYQASAMANAGSPVAHVVSLAEAEGAYASSLALGLANVGATAGVAFAGAFDKGGVIPQGQVGIVSEIDKELVNGVMVMGGQGGTRVTSREDTAAMMAGNNMALLYANDYGDNPYMQSTSSTTSYSPTIQQNITVRDSYGDTALTQAMAKAAEMGAEKGAAEGYARVSKDFTNGRGIRAQLKRSTGM